MKKMLLSMPLLFLSIVVMSQGIITVSPNSSPLNATGVVVSIVLDSATAPPGPIIAASVNIGPAPGASVTRTNQYLTATFNFTHMVSGTYNVVVVFPGPTPNSPPVYFTTPAAFTVTDTITRSWAVNGTNVVKCYDTIQVIPCPANPSAPFYGQYNGTTPSFVNNGDGTITDQVTGLMWQHDPGAKKTYVDALSGASSLTLGGHSDWRMPTIKELYSLIEFTGTDPSGVMNGISLSLLTPFIDTNYFVFHYGDTTAGDRIIDAQYWSCTEYVSMVMGHDHSVFGVNFADGRIKSYGRQRMNADTKMFTLYVRGTTGYGLNHFVDNGDSTVTDMRTHLMWSQGDCGHGMNWQAALAWVQSKNAAGWLGHSDWRLPTTKELESIIDYSRSPSTTNSPAIDPVFHCTAITNEASQPDYPCYWAATTHADFSGHGGFGVYVAFGRAMGYFNSLWQDVHGAGAQRSDPKQGDPNAWPTGHGPQGDAIRINNYLRCVRDVPSLSGIGQPAGDSFNLNIAPNPSHGNFTVSFSLLQDSPVRIECVNAAGMTIYASDKGMTRAGVQRFPVSLSAVPGLVVVKIFYGSSYFMKKVVIL
ncbi:MAG: DUF1566 domain-containing protein [Bacteroidota bacterium]